MNWVSSSLQLAGTLLESVDQHAALTLSGVDEEEGGGGAGDESGPAESGEAEEGLLSTIKKGISRATESARGTPKASDDEWEAGEDQAEEGEEGSGFRGGDAPTQGRPIPVRSPPGSTSSAKSVVRQTPPPSSSGNGVRILRSPSAPGASSSSMEAEVARLQKENAKLKSDLRLKDKALATHQQSVRVYEDEIEALEKECTNKLVETQQQMAQLRIEKDADEKNFVQALELKETQVQALQSDLRTAQEAERRRTEEAEQLRAEIARAEESKDSLWTNAASASQQSDEIVASLRLELQEAQTSLSHAKREFAEAKAKMYDRQAQLEKTNAELSTSVATLGRELAKAKESAAALTPDGNAVGAVTTAAAHAQMQDEYRKLQQTLVVMKKSLHDETRKNEIHVQEVQSLTYEVKRLKEQLVAAQDETAKQVLVLTKTNAELQEKLVEWETAASQQTASKDSEARIRTLTNRLIEKQESIDALRSKITTLDMRLADAQNRSETAENKLAQIERNGGVVAMDMEMGTSIAVGRKGGARVRSNRMAHTISRVAPVVERSARVVSALDGLDRWLLFLGRVFLSMPVARLALLCYVALIHFWVFMVLSFHTSHLNEEVHESPTGANAPGMFPDGMEVPP